MIKNVMGFILGAILGAAVALMLAPSSGEELRANIKTQADTQYAKLQDEWQKGAQKVYDRMDKMSGDPQAISGKVNETDTGA